MNPFLRRRWLTIDLLVFTAGLLVLTSAFIIARRPFYECGGLASLQPDFASYNQMALNLKNGIPVDLSYRTLGYPLFIWLTTAIDNSWAFVVTVQIIVSYLASLLMIGAVQTINRWATPIVAAGLAGWQVSGNKTVMDCAILSDSLYASCMMAALALILLAVRFRRPALFVFASMGCASAIYMRPSGMVLFAALGVVGVYLWIAGTPKRRLTLLFVPAMLLLLPAYVHNYWKYGHFTFSDGSAITLIITTGSFLSPDPSYPASWNAAIGKIDGFVDPEDRKIILNSWDLPLFYSRYHKYFDCGRIWNAFASASKSLLEGYTILKTVAVDAIKKHPATYLKIVLFNFYTQAFRYSALDIDYLSHLQDIYRLVFLQKIYTSEPKAEFLKEYDQRDGLPGYRVDVDKATVELEKSSAALAYDRLVQFYRRHFLSPNWGYILLATVFLAGGMVISPLRNDAYLVSFVVSSFVALHILGVSLFTSGELRMPMAVNFGIPIAAAVFFVKLIEDIVSWTLGKWRSRHPISVP